VELLEKRIVVAEKKLEAFEMERQLYLDERDELLRSNAAEEKLVPFETRISQMDSIIDAEQNIISSLESEQRQAQQFIAETDRVMEELNQQIHEQYNRQEIIESFIISEKDRLQRELELISETRRKLVDQQAAIATELEQINKQMASMDRDIILIKNREMSEILDRQASMEQSEADLANEELSMMEEFMGRIIPTGPETSDSLGEEMKSLLKLGDEIDSLNAMIQAEKTGIAVTQKQLAEQRARVSEQRARFGKAAGLTVLLLILAGAGVLTLFYFMGRKARANK
jgi:chromosome segregation ATPase